MGRRRGPDGGARGAGKNLKAALQVSGKRAGVIDDLEKENAALEMHDEAQGHVSLSVSKGLQWIWSD